MKIKKIIVVCLLLFVSLDLSAKVSSYSSAEVNCSTSMRITDNENALIGLSKADSIETALQVSSKESRSRDSIIIGSQGSYELFVRNRLDEGIRVELSEWTSINGFSIQQSAPVYIPSGTRDRLVFDITVSEEMSAGSYNPKITLYADWEGGQATIEYPISITVIPKPVALTLPDQAQPVPVETGRIEPDEFPVILPDNAQRKMP